MRLAVKGIVAAHLLAHGHDGLAHPTAGCGCGCLVDNLMPCDESADRCVPGRKVACDGSCEWGPGCEWHVVPAEEEREASHG